jgi:chromosome segregation protein
MFKLQRLEITGFKSFADYTEVVFTGNGITAVVGPNGCGKSNVSESIAWVLGEQRAKALRGAEMKDVIFQGTKTRKAGGMAEVVLHLERVGDSMFFDDEEDLVEIDEALASIDDKAVDVDALENPQPVAESAIETNGHNPENGDMASNFVATENTPVVVQDGQVSDAGTENAEVTVVETAETAERKIKTRRHWRPRSFALDFAPGETVSVTRRLYLSGESEYLLNGKTCRLRDIQDLFAGTGLSGAHYAIIEQGRIGQILSAKPSDRRSLIEEAAGISKFRTRQRAAESRLDSAKTNLSRITDIVAEVEKTANSLRRQAAKTRRYKTLKDEFRVLIKQLFAAEGKHLTALVSELDRQLVDAVSAEQKLGEQLEEKDVAVKEATQIAREAEESLATVRARHAENALERDRNEREKIYREEQIQSLTARAKDLEHEIEATVARLEVATSEIERLKKEEERERLGAEEAETAYREAEAVYQSKMEEVFDIEKQLEREREEVVRHTGAVERFAEVERQLEYNIERLNERLAALQHEAMRAEESLLAHRAEVERIQRELVEKREKLSGFDRERQELLALTESSRGSLENAERTLAELRSEYSLKKNRLETLRELDQQRAIYTAAVQKVYAEQESIGVKFLGTLADKVVVDRDNEASVESLFGTLLQTILVETVDDAKKITSWLKKNNAGRVSVLVTGPDGFDSGETKFGLPTRIADVISEIFPRHMAALDVADISSVDPQSGSYIDSDGDLVVSGRLFVSGKGDGDGEGASLLTFRREMRELEQSITEIARRLEEAEKTTEGARKELSEKEEQIVDLQSLIVQIEREVLGLEIQEKSERQECERAERHKKVVGDETSQLQRESEEIGSRVQEAKKSGSEAAASRQTSSDNLSAITQRLGEVRAKLESDSLELNQKRTAAAMSEERRRGAQNTLQRVEGEYREFDSRHQRQKAELKETDGRKTTLAESIAELHVKIASAAEQIDGERVELESSMEHLKVARESADRMSADLAELNKIAAEARDARAGIEIRKTEAATELKNLNESCAHELGQPLIEITESEELDPEFNLEEARANAEDLRSKIEGIGDVNMLAVDELAEAEERLLFLTSQMQDIVDSIAAAEEALAEIKSRSRERFRKAFEAINENFTEFFTELFGGGHGQMALLEADDILEAGIEVIAQPPGKRLQNILLLSGGEKAMTAIALVMAIFKYRPSPFCLLDEVDAPLDEANVGRFVAKIAEMAEDTQFIIITHNKKTMEAARALYGVTMQEAGVSKIVSVRFE